MAHIPIHDVSRIALTRLGRIAQIDALLPRAPTTPAAVGWDPRRRRTLLGNYRTQFRPGNIELGEIIQSEPPAGFTSESGSSSSRATPIFIDYSQQVTYSLALRTQANLFRTVSTPPIPFAFAVTQCSVTWHGAAAINEAGIGWNLLVVDAAPDEELDNAPSGERLITPQTAVPGLTASIYGPLIGGRPNGSISTGPLGRYISASGKRLAFVVQDIAGGHNNDIVALVTLAPITGGGGSFRTTTPSAPSPTQPPPGPAGSPAWEQIF